MSRWMMALIFALTACAEGSNQGSTTDQAAMPGDVVDSILPMAEYERRFRVGLTETTELRGGESDLEALGRRVLDAIAARDTAALASLAITRAEFAWLVFPSHLYHDAPYELDPALFWLQVQQGSSKGAGLLLRHYGGRDLSLERIECTVDSAQVPSGSDLRIWAPCDVGFRSDGRLVTGRIFGSIVELNGRFKLMGYANDL